LESLESKLLDDYEEVQGTSRTFTLTSSSWASVPLTTTATAADLFTTSSSNAKKKVRARVAAGTSTIIDGANTHRVHFRLWFRRVY